MTVRSRTDPVLLVGVAAQLAVAVGLPLAPLALYMIIDVAAERARARVPAEAAFIDGYAGGVLFSYRVLTLVCAAYGLVVAAIAVRCLIRATVGRAALLAPWPAVGPMLCVAVISPATDFDFGDPDGYGLVSVPDWTVPALAWWAGTMVTLLLIHTTLAVMARACRPSPPANAPT